MLNHPLEACAAHTYLAAHAIVAVFEFGKYLLTIAQCNLQLHLLGVPFERHLDGGARIVALDLLNHLGSLKYFFSVHGKNDITFFHSRLFSRAFLGHLGHLHTAKSLAVFAAEDDPDHAARFFNFACYGAAHAAPHAGAGGRTGHAGHHPGAVV